jgi:putative ABC transport system permease protein
MYLALREMRRAKTRFALLVGAIALLVFLILTQQALQDGLITSFVGAIRQQSAPVLVFSTDGQKTLQGSVIPPPLEQLVRATEGVGAAGRIGQGTFTVRVDGGEATSDAAIIGADDRSLGGVRHVDRGRQVEEFGEAVGSATDFSVGDRVQVVPVGVPGGEGPTFMVVGLVDEARLQVTPSLFTSWAGYEGAARAANPEAETILPNVIGLRPADGTTAEQLVAAVNARSEDADALTRAQAATEAPGVGQVQQSFRVIFLLFGLVVPLVTGLFFLIVTLQKSASLTLLRAIGVDAATLVRSLLFQVVVVVAGGLLVGTALYWPLSQQTVGAIVLRFDATAVGFWSLLLVALGLLSALVAARRVLRIDPIEATAGGGGR